MFFSVELERLREIGMRGTRFDGVFSMPIECSAKLKEFGRKANARIRVFAKFPPLIVSTLRGIIAPSNLPARGERNA